MEEKNLAISDPAAEGEIISSPEAGEVPLASLLMRGVNILGIIILAGLILRGLSVGSWGVLVAALAVPGLIICILNFAAASVKKRKTRLTAIIINAILVMIILFPFEGYRIIMEMISDRGSMDEQFLFSMVFFPAAINLLLLILLQISVNKKTRPA